MSASMFNHFKKQTHSVNSINIHCRVGGSGPGLLLLHGHPQTHVIWHKVADQLARNFTVVAADLRGYGDSDRPTITDGSIAYSNCLRLPGAAVSICEDYRASAGIDLRHDREELKSGNTLKCPIQVLWGKDGVVGLCFDPLKEWRKVAGFVQGQALPSGHYIPEEVPQILLEATVPFLKKQK